MRGHPGLSFFGNPFQRGLYGVITFAYFLDFKSGLFIEKTTITMFGKGCDLPETVQGAVEFNHPDLKLSFDDRGSTVEISAEWADFGGQKLEAHPR